MATYTYTGCPCCGPGLGCCSGTSIPSTLHATVHARSSPSCFDGTYALTFKAAGSTGNQSGNDEWSCDATGLSCPNCVELKLAVYFSGGSCRLNGVGVDGSGTARSSNFLVNATSVTCSPLSLSFALNFSGTAQCGGVATWILDVTVTT